MKNSIVKHIVKHIVALLITAIVAALCCGFVWLLMFDPGLLAAIIVGAVACILVCWTYCAVLSALSK